MKKAFKEIKKLVDRDKPTLTKKQLEITLHLAKLSEEFGELAQAVNKINGRKSLKKGDTEEAIFDNIEEEAADTIQCVMAIAIVAGVNYDSLNARIKRKNTDYKKGLKK